MQNTKCVILAAGKGTRMNEGNPSPIPKALYLLNGQPMISYILTTLKNVTEVEEKPLLVIGYKGELVREKFGNNCEYVEQKEQLGTGHAVKIAVEAIGGNHKNLMVLQADDSAFYKEETLKKFILEHDKNQSKISFLVTKIPNYKDFGRVIRDDSGNVLGIVEKEHLKDDQAEIGEINCGGYLFDFAWLKNNISKLEKTLKGKEYPLPDLIKISLSQGDEVKAFEIDNKEWFGINSREQLKEAEKIM
jgi:bifunctional UDP-N-acetylglucosamine pyrophosphorylase/glucosamine-1-phosphate N-acetyltransferase